jgi:hypothetical protein
MFVFWWTGKGYLTPVIMVVTLIVFAVILKIGGSWLPDRDAFWGTALLVSAAANWIVGRRMNARKLAAVRSSRLEDRLFYRARNKFMSMPLETFSIVIAVFGIWVIVADIVRS